MNHDARSQNSPTTVCFPLPESVTPAANFVLEREDGLAGDLSSAAADGLSRIIATMMCGEESATHVFNNEGNRLSDQAICASTSVMYRIAGEEAEHENLLSAISSQLPKPSDLDTLRSRTRFFFIRVASREPAIHFSRIVGLDSGVCMSLNSMLQSGAAISAAPEIHRILRHIWKDEASHVRVSRRHVLDLGLEERQLREESRNVREAYANRIVQPLGDAFEAIGVDTDALRRRLVKDDI
jgi:hypothetical protein